MKLKKSKRSWPLNAITINNINNNAASSSSSPSYSTHIHPAVDYGSRQLGSISVEAVAVTYDPSEIAQELSKEFENRWARKIGDDEHTLRRLGGLDDPLSSSRGGSIPLLRRLLPPTSSIVGA